MLKSQYISLQDASLMVNKSPQTIRRLIKGNKVRYRKYKTPQGFTYLVEKNNLQQYFEEIEETDEDFPNDDIELVESFDPDTPQIGEIPRPNPITPPPSASASQQAANNFQAAVITQLIQQHRDDKARLFELLEMFQKRILILEDQIKRLDAPKKKRRWLLF
ncbi:MAG: hypothetical protein UT55_C0087G0007 [Candidatus Peregrinibacteria bacterium GW2011_GWE2_39_6]|nr:MAG: hypothetical protein UT55_C0087G0007 [Candidatus Peregrinibacteria bacterium GW2011_GWE2_39_6]